MSFVVTVVDFDRILPNEAIGQVIIGYRTAGTSLKHWTDMMNHPRKTIAMWHKIIRYWWALVCWGIGLLYAVGWAAIETNWNRGQWDGAHFESTRISDHQLNISDDEDIINQKYSIDGLRILINVKEVRVFTLSDHNELMLCQVLGPEIGIYENNGANLRYRFQKTLTMDLFLIKWRNPSLYLEQYQLTLFPMGSGYPLFPMGEGHMAPPV